MNHTFIAGIIMGIVGIGAGYFFGYDIGAQRALGQHTMQEGHAMTTDTVTVHTHERMEAPSPIPTIALEVVQDPKSGYNAHITLTNFVFAPEHASAGFVPGEGHAHIYVNGIKINRVYGEWYYLGTLQKGTNEVVVRISTNDHKELTYQGSPIEAKAFVEVP